MRLRMVHASCLKVLYLLSLRYHTMLTKARAVLLTLPEIVNLQFQAIY